MYSVCFKGEKDGKEGCFFGFVSCLYSCAFFCLSTPSKAVLQSTPSEKDVSAETSASKSYLGSGTLGVARRRLGLDKGILAETQKGIQMDPGSLRKKGKPEGLDSRTLAAETIII